VAVPEQQVSQPAKVQADADMNIDPAILSILENR
jgi:hypothetical protein